MDKEDAKARKPLVKSTIAPTRVSTLTKPTATSSSRASSTLSRPTASTLRKAAGTPASRSATPTHRSSNSVASTAGKASDDEQQHGTTTRKQLSMAPTTSTSRPGTTITRGASTTLSLASKGGVKSPTSTRSSTRTPTADKTSSTTSTLAVSTVPASARPTSSLRSTLSTQSSAVRPKPIRTATQRLDTQDESKTLSPVTTRPVLGMRKSTRSMLMQKRIFELELVQQMLETALSVGQLDAQERQNLHTEAAEMLENLRTSTRKIREFEEEHGRPPSEEEIAAIESIEIDYGPTSPVEARQNKTERRLLEEELAQSQAHAKHLEERLEDLTEKLQQFSTDVDEQGDKVNAVAEAARTEHANKMRDMSSANQARLDHLRMIHREELEELRTQHEEVVADLMKQREEEVAEKDAALEVLRAQIETLAEQVANADVQKAELEELQTKHESLQHAHVASNDRAQGLKKRIEELEVYDRELETKDREIARLQTEIARLPAQSHAEERSQIESSTNMEAQKAGNLAKELEALRTQHNTHLASATKLRDQKMVELETKHEEELESSRRDLESMRSTLTQREDELQRLHLRNAEDLNQLTKDIAAQTEALAQAENAQRELDQKSVQLSDANDRIGILEKDINILRQHVETNKKQSSNEMRELQQQIEHKDAEVEKQAETVKQLQQLMQYKTEKHEKALEDLNTMHAERLKQLEDDGIASLASLEAIESATNARIQKLQADHIEEKENTLADLRKAHSETTDKLQEQVHALQRQISDSTANHQADLDQLQSAHKSSQDRALRALRDEYAQKVIELEQQIKTQSDHEEKEHQHKQQVEELEAQIQKLSSQAQNASFQIQTMRNVIRSNEEESQNRIKELEAELEKTEGQFSQAVVKISQNSYQMSQLQAESRQARAAQDAEHEEVIACLKKEHEAAIESTRAELSMNSGALEQKLRAEHEKAVENMQRQIQSHNDHIEVIRKTHQEDLSALASSHQNALSQLRDAHAAELAETKQSLQRNAQANRHDLIKAHQSELNQHQDESAATVAKIQQQHREKIVALEQQLSNATTKMNDTSAVDQVSAQLKTTQEALDAAQSAHAEVLKKLRQEHDNAVSSLESQISKLQAIVSAPKDTSREDELQAELASTTKKLDDMSQTHGKLISETREQHEAALQLLRAELTNTNTGAQSDKSAESARLEATANENTTMLNQIAELKLTIDHLSAEAETQRKRSEMAEAEIAELRGAAKLHVNTGASPSISSRVRSEANSTRSSPKGGLASSKWATIDESVQDGLVVGISEDIPAPVRRSSVHGQLASINEDIKSLNDLSEQMLAQNRLMAKTLSRVDEHTGTVELA